MNSAVTIDWTPLLPWPAVMVFALAALALLGLALWRRAPGIGLRTLSLAALILALANPSIIKEQRDPLDDIVMVVIDESPSQAIQPRGEQSRAASDHIIAELESLRGTELRVVRAGAATAGKAEDGTRLFSALGQALSQVPRQRVGGVIVISDGQVHDVPENFAALGIDAPLHLLLTGREDEGDRRLLIGQAPSFGIVGDALTLKLTVEDLGPDDEPIRGPSLARVVIRQNGDEKLVVQVPVGVEQEVTFTLDRRGPSVLEVEADPGPKELSLANNRAAVVVNGVRDRLRVLLVSGEPHAGERAWRNILKSDPSVDLVHFTILRPPEKQDGTPIHELSLIAFPTRELFEIKLDEFDLIIFDRYRRRGVLPSIYLENIARYVENGGALLEAVGPTFATPLSLYRTALGRVLPAEPSGTIFERGYRPRVTEVGERHPVTARLPGAQTSTTANDAGGENPGGENDGKPAWGRWFRQIDADPKQGGAVVMDGIENRPLLVLDRIGEGRVAQLLSDHIWLWSRGFEGGGPQAELLRRVAHWLMKEPDLEEEDLRATITGQRMEIQRRSLGDALPEIEVTLPSGARRNLDLTAESPGRARAILEVEETGLYRVTDGSRSTLATVGPLNPREFEDLRASPAPLKSMIAASGGAIVRLASGDLPALRKVQPGRDRKGRDWLGIAANRGYVVTGVNQVPLLPGVLVLLLVLGATLAAWYREGR